MSSELPILKPTHLQNVLRDLMRSRDPVTKRFALTHHIFAERALSAGSFTAGGATVQSANGGLADALRPYSVAIASGMTFLPLDSRDQTYAGITTGAEAAWVSETGEVPVSQVEFNGLVLSPKRCGTSILASNQLWSQSPTLASFAFERDLRSAIGLAIDLAAFSGVGGPEPVGVCFTEGIPEPLSFGGAATLDDICEIEEAVSLNFGERPGDAAMSFITSPKARNKMRQAEAIAGSGKPLWSNNRLIDRPAFASPVMSATHQLLYGYWPDWLVASFGVIELISDPFTHAKNSQTEITVNAFMDCGCFRRKSFARSTDSAAQ